VSEYFAVSSSVCLKHTQEIFVAGTASSQLVTFYLAASGVSRQQQSWRMYMHPD
jgi:hypothetical protein